MRSYAPCHRLRGLPSGTAPFVVASASDALDALVASAPGAPSQVAPVVLCLLLDAGHRVLGAVCVDDLDDDAVGDLVELVGEAAGDGDVRAPVDPDAPGGSPGRAGGPPPPEPATGPVRALVLASLTPRDDARRAAAMVAAWERTRRRATEAGLVLLDWFLVSDRTARSLAWLGGPLPRWTP